MYMERNKILVDGPPFAVNHDCDADRCDMECGFPTEKPEAGEGIIKSSLVPGRKMRFRHSYRALREHNGDYETVQEFIRKEGLKPKKVMFERYLSDPATVKDPDQIYCPID
jgi:effector-binding domain-containing protein